MNRQEVNRQEVIAAVRAQAWDEGKTCPTCNGDGKVRPGRRIVHCSGSFTSADWDEDSVVATVESAQHVGWLVGPADGHNLRVVDENGQMWRFQVSHPALGEVIAQHGRRPNSERQAQ